MCCSVWRWSGARPGGHYGTSAATGLTLHPRQDQPIWLARSLLYLPICRKVPGMLTRATFEFSCMSYSAIHVDFANLQTSSGLFWHSILLARTENPTKYIIRWLSIRIRVNLLMLWDYCFKNNWTIKNKLFCKLVFVCQTTQRKRKAQQRRDSWMEYFFALLKEFYWSKVCSVNIHRGCSLGKPSQVFTKKNLSMFLI